MTPVPEGPQLVRAEDLVVHYPAGRTSSDSRAVVHAVDGVSLNIRAGETLGLVGESGSGKTTVGRALLRRVPVVSGRIWFDGQDITGLRGEALRQLRSKMQLVFQDPYSSLDSRRRILSALAEPFIVHGVVRRARDAVDRVADLLDAVGLPVEAMYRYPHTFSGGQLQRIGVARAIALDPAFVVADEPVSALDVSIQAQVVTLLKDLQAQRGLAYLFITHDISIVSNVAHRIAVMYAGKIVEEGASVAVCLSPRHPYTEALLSAVIVPRRRGHTRRRIVLQGELPNPISPPRGCRFNTRCPIAQPRCFEEEPPLEVKADGHLAACWFR